MKHIPRAVFTMAAGGVLTQLIPLAVAPILTRLYSPEAFGLVSTFTAFAAVAAIPATLRLELAVILAVGDVEAARLTAYILVLSTVLLSVFGCALLAVHWLMVPLQSLHPLGPLLLLVPMMAWLIALQGTLMIVTNRRRAYGTAAASGVVQQTVNAAMAVLLALAGAQAVGLIASRCAAYVSGCLAMLRGGTSGFFEGVKLQWADALGTLKRYYQFPVFNVAYSISGLLSRDFPIIALTSTGHIAAAGQFAIARMAASVPGAFLTSSLSNMFYREATEFLGDVRFTEALWTAFRSLAQIGFPFFVALGLVGEELFRFVFGERWHGAGEVVAYLALPFALTLLTGWPERVFEARGKQNWSFTIQVSFDAMTIAGVLIVLGRGGSPLEVVRVFAAIQTCYQLAYLAGIFILADLGLLRLAKLLGRLALIAAGLLLVNDLLVQWHALGEAHRGLLLLAVAAVVALPGARPLIRFVRRGATGAHGTQTA